MFSDMSFIKALKCFVCSGEHSISDVNFPEDLFDLITKYKVEQLMWLCNLCKIDRNPSVDSARLPLQNNSEQVTINLSETHKTGFCDPIEYVKDISIELQNDLSKTEKVSESFDCKVTNALTIMSAEANESSNTKEDKYGLKYAHKILNVIKINPDEEKNSKEIAQKVISCLLRGLRKNVEFDSLFNRMVYTGSSYNGLRITSASECDINIVLKVPKYIKLSVECYDNSCSFGKLKWEVTNENETCLAKKFFTNNSNGNYLVPILVINWLQSQIDLVLKQGLTYPTGVVSVKSCRNGPARTIVVETNLGYTISVDLVAVFEFDYSSLQGMHVYAKLTEPKDINKSKWYMVPKECQDQIDATSSEITKYWRLDYPNADKQILSGKECAKSVIKILKIFRDKKDWKGLASYYLNMVVILEIVKQPEAEFWKNGNLFHRLMDAFKSLKHYLAVQHLPHFLTNNNLLHKFNKNHCMNWQNHLGNLIPSWESNPEKLIEDCGIKLL